MRKIFGVLAVAGLTALSAGAASAQGLGVRIGPNGVRIEEDRPVYRERIIERRPVRARTVCRTEYREHVRRNGVVVRRPVEICRREFAGGRRVYVD